MRHTVLAVGAMSAASVAALAGGPVSWLNAVNGNWNAAANWDPAVVPGLSDEVLIGLAGSFTVTATVDTGAGSLDISNPDATLAINGGRTLTSGGTIINDGLVVLNTTGASATTTLNFSNPGSLSGAGVLRLNANGAFARVLGSGFTHGAGHAIMGRGQIEAAMVNEGLVSADVAGQAMLLTIGEKTNNAVMEAVNGATLRMSGVSVPQGPAGVLSASGTGSVLDFTGATVVGGTVRGIDGGLARVSGSTDFEQALLEGVASIDAGDTLNVRGGLVNDAVLTVNPAGSAATTTLSFESGADLTGSGRVVLNGSGNFARITGDGDTPVPHAAGHTIEGRGALHAALVNNGAVVANVTGAEMGLATEDKVNNADFRAEAGATLRISSVFIDQSAGGDTVADGAGSVWRWTPP